MKRQQVLEQSEQTYLTQYRAEKIAQRLKQSDPYGWDYRPQQVEEGLNFFVIVVYDKDGEKLGVL